MRNEWCLLPVIFLAVSLLTLAAMVKRR